MIRLYADFNASTPEGECYILMHGDVHLDSAAEHLHLNVGDRVLLYQDEDDFEVEAILDHRYVPYQLRDEWIAIPDWTTLRDISPGAR